MAHTKNSTNLARRASVATARLQLQTLCWLMVTMAASCQAQLQPCGNLDVVGKLHLAVIAKIDQ